MKKLMVSFCVITVLYITHHTATNASSNRHHATRMQFEMPDKPGGIERPVPTAQTAPDPQFRINNIVPSTNQHSLFV